MGDMYASLQAGRPACPPSSVGDASYAKAYHQSKDMCTVHCDTHAGGSWGEVPPAQGGVIIPYLGSYNLTAGAVNRVGVSFGYSDCLKWGYADSIQLAAFDAVQAADVLGLDLTRVSKLHTA